MTGNLSQLEELLKSKEGEKLEFKEWKTKDNFDELAKYCCALANEGGGQIVLGVTDQRPRKVVGTSAFAQPECVRKSVCWKQHVRCHRMDSAACFILPCVSCPSTAE